MTSGKEACQKYKTTTNQVLQIELSVIFFRKIYNCDAFFSFVTYSDLSYSKREKNDSSIGIILIELKIAKKN